MSSSSEQEDLQQDGSSSEEEEVLSGETGAVDEDTEDEGESEAGVSEAEDSDGKDDSEVKQPALDASSTESDEDDDDEVDDDKDIPKKKSKTPAAPPIIDKLTQQMQEKYEKRKGKQLFIRFPQKLPEDKEEFDKKVKAISELIVTAHKPRQKHARFCLVDFATTQDRDETLKKLKKHSAENKLMVSLPKAESDDFIKKLTELRKKKLEKKRTKQLLRKEKKNTPKGKNYTSTIVILNVPKTASVAQIKELFPNAVDMQIKPAPSKFDGYSIATITLPSTLDASKSCKRNLTLGGNKLIIRFNNENKKNRKMAKKNKQQAGEKKGPLAPTPLVSNGDKQKSPKKANKTNKVKPPKDEAGSPTKQKLPLSKKREPKDDESKVPNKKAKLTKTPQQPTAEGKGPIAPKKEKKNGKFPQKEGNAPPNKKAQGKKPNNQFKQKAKPQKKGKLAAK